MAVFQIANPPTKFGMNDFLSISNQYGGLLKSCRFAVKILPVGEKILSYSDIMSDFTYLCETAEMPGRGFMNLDLRYYGPNHKLPFQTQYEDMNFTFVCRTESYERQFFDDWLYEINPVNSFDFNYRDEYRATIVVYQFADYPDKEDDTYPKATYAITIHNAYPILVAPQPMTWADTGQFQKLTVSFTYTHWTRENRDPKPRTSPDDLPLVNYTGAQNIDNRAK